MFSPCRTEGDLVTLPAYYTPQEVAERSGLSRRRVYDWLSWGWLRGHRHGGRWVVTAQDWEFFTPKLVAVPEGD